MKRQVFPRPVDRMTACKRCGQKNCAWVQFKSGKWALCDVQHAEGEDGDALYAVAFHRCGT